MLHLLTIAALVLARGQAAPPQDPSTEPMLEIGLHTQRSDGRRSSFAGNHGIDLFQSYVWGNESLCWLSASGREPSTVPVIGWHFRGRVLKRTADNFLVEIEWWRLWDRSVRLSDGPKGSMQVTLRAGDRLLLDEIVPADVKACQIAGARLEAAIVPYALSRRLIGAATGTGAGATAGGSGTAGGGRGSGGGGAGFGTGSRAGGGGASGSGVGGGTVGAGEVGAGATGTGTGGHSGGAGGAGVGGRTIAAEVWLVHKLPSGTEDVQRLMFTFGRASTEFAFPPVDVAKDADKATVDVKGQLRLMGPAGQEKLMVSLDRTIKTDRTFGGSSVKLLEIPALDDVVSFELPLLPTDTDASLRALLAGHQFSVRLRVKTAAVLPEPFLQHLHDLVDRRLELAIDALELVWTPKFSRLMPKLFARAA